ncbi:BlaI/MecI/CopY family transcriptional regulator [Flavonifractor sp. An112]|uniref:BlaI/MecI/CopY family transcriptional regulator n=1 Tax=Flavonifractor sp. An112 TaxID=1965544 RepID=UPI0017487811|nr:BlaI/MecI/CopY family transcriptional regulator [Flavonifractor sp. An112]
MERSVSLSHSEWLIMQEIWKRGTATFREICDGVAAQNWSKPAVAAFLKRMEKKGAISCEEAKPVKLYRPLIQKEAAVQEETRQILDRVYGGDVALLAQSLVSSEALDSAEVEELITLLRKGREGS